MVKNVLLTGGLGYIGAHIAVELLNLNDGENQYNVIIIDNFINSNIDKLENIKKFIKNSEKLVFFEIDMLDYKKLDNLFLNTKVDIFIHLAGLKSVNESINKPILYYENNLVSTINLIKVMEKYNCKNIIFSSSSTVYGNLKAPYNENMVIGCGLTNPYGKSKYMQEVILCDLYNSNKDWNIILLRYFNPVGYKDNLLKEIPNGIPNNLFPYILKVHNKELPLLKIYGSDYDTIDGTCIRDFIHVEDLANGHVKACKSVLNNKNIGLKIYNLGSGKGTSVKQLIDEFEIINNTKINYIYDERREGDLDVSYANCSLANVELDWRTLKNIKDIVKL